MTSELLDNARTGLEAWLRGDLDALAPLLDPEVELFWWEPGEWDCHARDDVLSLLRRRKSEGAGADEVELIDAGGGAIVASRGAASPDGPDVSARKPSPLPDDWGPPRMGLRCGRTPRGSRGERRCADGTEC